MIFLTEPSSILHCTRINRPIMFSVPEILVSTVHLERSSDQNHVPSGVKWKLKSVERCLLWWAMDGGRTQNPGEHLLESTCSATHPVQKVQEDTFMERKGGFCRAQGGERQNLPPLWGVPFPGRHYPGEPLNCSILTHSRGISLLSSVAPTGAGLKS